MPSQKIKGNQSQSQLSRVYPAPMNVKHAFQNTPYASDGGTIRKRHKQNVSKKHASDMNAPTKPLSDKKLNRIRSQLKPRSGETVKFNGKVSTDRVLFKMLLSHQIHTILQLEKFHRLADQEGFYEALSLVLNQLEGRINRIYIGENRKAHVELSCGSCEHLSRAMLHMKEFWIRNVKLARGGMAYFTENLERIALHHDENPTESPALKCLGFVGTQSHGDEEQAFHLASIIRLNMDKLKRLIFNRNAITDEGMSAILDALAHNDKLKLLNLSENIISSESVDRIVNFLKIQIQTPCAIKKWSLARVNVSEVQARLMVEAFRDNDLIVELSLHNNTDIKKRTLMAITALLDINKDIQKLSKSSKKADSLREEKSRLIDYYIEQTDEQIKALYFLRTQKPPDFLELYALRLMRDLAHLEQQLTDMTQLIDMHHVETSREAKVERSIHVMQRVSQRMYKALKGLCPRVADDGFSSHIDRYENEVLAALSRDETLQEETEYSLNEMKEEIVEIQDRMEGVPSKSQQGSTATDRVEAMLAHTNETIDSDEQITDGAHQSDSAEDVQEPQQNAPNPKSRTAESGEAIYESDGGEDTPMETFRTMDSLSESRPELQLVQLRARMSKLREVQARITKRWQEVDLDDLDVPDELKERVVDMKIQCNASDSLGVFKNLEKRFLDANDSGEETVLPPDDDERKQ